MQNLIALIFSRSRLTVGLSLILSFAGILTWFTMSRQEDPTMSPRFGLIIAPYPGGSPEQVERLIVKPIEDELAEISGIRMVAANIRTGIAIVNVELQKEITDTQSAWTDIEKALNEATKKLPDAAITPTLTTNLAETESVVIALTGTQNVLNLADRAEKLKSHLMSLRDVSRVEIAGYDKDQITISFEESVFKKLQLSPERIVQEIKANNISAPGGSIRIGTRQLSLQPSTEFRTIDEIKKMPIILGNGELVLLGDITEIRRMLHEPLNQGARMNGEVAVFVGIVPTEGTDALKFGKLMNKEIENFSKANSDINISILAFQPEQVAQRLKGLGKSLLLGILIVGFILLLTMGFRLGAVVASVVPLVTFATITIYGAIGGVFHQTAAAALVLALGMLVDNAIVMSELVQANLDEGRERRDAILGAVQELAIPLLSSTATTLAAFVPMLLAPGNTGEFTRSIPIVAMIALSVSYVFAMVVTPLFSGYILKPRIHNKESWTDKLATILAKNSVKRPVITILLALVVIGISGSFAPLVKKNFFPPSDKNQIVVTIETPPGTHIDATNIVTKKVERFLLERSKTKSVAAFVGRSAPHFYYNIPLKPSATHLAQIIVTVNDTDDVIPMIREIESYVSKNIYDANVIPRQFEQGPPVAAAVEVRIKGADLQTLYTTSERVRRIMREVKGTKRVRADHGPGNASIVYEVNDVIASRHGIKRGSLVSTMYGRTMGLNVGDYRAYDDITPIQIRGNKGYRASLADISAFEIPGRQGSIPIGKISQPKVIIGPSVIRHHQGLRTITALSDVEEGLTYASIVDELRPKLEAMDFPEGVEWELGGLLEASLKANESLGENAPLAIILLLAILLAQFNSFRRTFIVLITAPMAILGIWPGLFIGNLSFGFIALLGSIALIGIVVNAAIVLIDVIELERKKGALIADAIEAAVRKRTRPILLTTLTTVSGLAPLLFSKSTLWPPMAAAMVSGLTIATVLTLVAIPALYRLLFRKENDNKLVTMDTI